MIDTGHTADSAGRAKLLAQEKGKLKKEASTSVGPAENTTIDIEGAPTSPSTEHAQWAKSSGGHHARA